MKFYLVLRIVLVGTLFSTSCIDAVPINGSSPELLELADSLTDASGFGEIWHDDNVEPMHEHPHHNKTSSLDVAFISDTLKARSSEPIDLQHSVFVGASFIDPKTNLTDLNATTYNATTQSINIPLNNTSGAKQVIILSPDVLQTLEGLIHEDEEKESKQLNATIADPEVDESKFVVRLARALQHVQFFPMVPETYVLNSQEVVEHNYDFLVEAASQQRGRFATKSPQNAGATESNISAESTSDVSQTSTLSPILSSSSTQSSSQRTSSSTKLTTMRTLPTLLPHNLPGQGPRRQAQFSNNVYNGPVIVISNVKDLKIVNQPSAGENSADDLEDLDDDFDIVNDLRRLSD